jgi:hypothetical protein
MVSNDVKLKDISKITIDEIDEQIDVRRKLIKDMVGNLYPDILNSEIDKLIERKR